MTRGVIFVLTNLITSFIISFLVMSGLEYLTVSYILPEFFNISYLTLDVFYVNMLTLFSIYIFTRKDLTNFLFISGYSRKNIYKIKCISTIIINIVSYIIVISIIYSLNGFVITNYLSVVYLANLFLMLILTSNFASFVNLIYRKKSLNKSKDSNKYLFKYLYTIVFIVVIYLNRIGYKMYSNIFNYEILQYLVTAIVLILLIALCKLSKNKILKLDIK